MGLSSSFLANKKTIFGDSEDFLLPLIPLNSKLKSMGIGAKKCDRIVNCKFFDWSDREMASFVLANGGVDFEADMEGALEDDENANNLTVYQQLIDEQMSYGLIAEQRWDEAVTTIQGCDKDSLCLPFTTDNNHGDVVHSDEILLDGSRRIDDQECTLDCSNGSSAFETPFIADLFSYDNFCFGAMGFAQSFPPFPVNICSADTRDEDMLKYPKETRSLYGSDDSDGDRVCSGQDISAMDQMNHMQVSIDASGGDEMLSRNIDGPDPGLSEGNSFGAMKTCRDSSYNKGDNRKSAIWMQSADDQRLPEGHISEESIVESIVTKMLTMSIADIQMRLREQISTGVKKSLIDVPILLRCEH